MRTASLLHAVFLALAVSAVSADGTNGRDLTFTAKMLPGCDLHTNVASRAGWLWNSDEPVRDGGVSHFRKTFDLKDEVVSAKLRIKLDDGGTLWVNGRNVPFVALEADPVALKAALAKGPNVIAVRVVNGAASAGAIFRGQFDLRDGTRVSIVSDRTVKAAAKADEGWQQVGFDDSAWKGPVWIGDAMCWPWSELAPMEKFLSVAEKAAWDRDDEAGRCRLPPGLADEPEMDAKVVWKDGVAWISLNGELHMPEFNLVGAKYPWTASQLLRFRDIGIHFHDFQFAPGAVLGETRDGKPGLTVNEIDGSKTYFSATWQFDMTFIRRLVKEAGVFVYADGEDPLEANDAFAALHARNAGMKEVRLPRKVRRVVDMFARKLVASDTDRFTFDAQLHESFLFYYGD